MANINKTLEETMKIDGAIGAAIADWDSGMCLGTAGGGTRLNIEVAAAGNCQVVKAKMATMSELGIKGAIQDILITLDDQIHLIRPLRRSENLFLYVAIDKAKGNLALAIGLGMVLVALIMLVNALAWGIRQWAQRHAGCLVQRPHLLA